MTEVWERSSFCDGGSCTEVAFTDAGVLVRDGKDPDGPRLAFTREEWSAFVAGCKAGEFDG